MLFINFSSAFNTITPDILIPKLVNPGLPPPTCSWIKDFLVNRPQRVKLGPHLSLLPHSQHWLSPGLCAEPTTPLPLHIRLQYRLPQRTSSLSNLLMTQRWRG
ncbi:hypothetical protein N1851_024004 [Merluccius polli]|uniref:Reverse transcriptase domain-containing protein n=1 Tax=Merluccius polli TaxID=89951 RepID=A0AA47MFU2_MERPO|nr:hypothetical protein N1851_024004 [Merluccius polli]